MHCCFKPVNVPVPNEVDPVPARLKRAASSIVLNIAEGAGEFSKKEKVRFYRIALRSATESASVTDILLGFEYIDQQLHDELDNALSRIIAMLTKLIKRHEGNKFSGRAGTGSTSFGTGTITG